MNDPDRLIAALKWWDEEYTPALEAHGGSFETDDDLYWWDPHGLDYYDNFERAELSHVLKWLKGHSRDELEALVEAARTYARERYADLMDDDSAD